MEISLIWAMAENRVIGHKNKLPWRLPADLAYFKKVTLGKPIIMGRKTFESFGAKPLPKRLNIIISRDKHYQADGCIVVDNIDAAIAAAGDVEEVMIIGGASFYEQMLPRADRLYLTNVDAEFDADAWFPEISRNLWAESFNEYHQADRDNNFSYTFSILDRVVQ